VFRFEKKSLEKRFENVADDFYELQRKFESVCKLLGIGFYGDSDYPSAGFIDKDKSRKASE